MNKRTTDEMLATNVHQAKYYDNILQAELESAKPGHVTNKSSNIVTRIWARLRYRQKSAVKQAGVRGYVATQHTKWMNRKAGGNFLELGCFSGSYSTMELADIAGTYLGVDLSPAAVGVLNEKFTKLGIADKARAEAIDLLTMPPKEQFDLIYGYGVLHHFENPEPLFEKLAELCKPGGLLIFADPSAINPVYKLVRGMYRPFQADANWEWPFRQVTVNALEKHFEVIEGFGWGSLSLMLSVPSAIPLAGKLIRPIYKKQLHREIAKGWHPKVWNNSYVTAVCQVRS